MGSLSQGDHKTQLKCRSKSMMTTTYRCNCLQAQRYIVSSCSLQTEVILEIVFPHFLREVTFFLDMLGSVTSSSQKLIKILYNICGRGLRRRWPTIYLHSTLEVGCQNITADSPEVERKFIFSVKFVGLTRQDFAWLATVSTRNKFWILVIILGEVLARLWVNKSKC